MPDDHEYPKLRPVELHPSREYAGAADLTDPSGISKSALTLAGGALFAVSRMNGSNHRTEIQAQYMVRHGNMLFSDELDRLITVLDESLFLEGPTLDAHMTKLLASYRQSGLRRLRDANSYCQPGEDLAGFLSKLLTTDEKAPTLSPIRGLVAPHLDYPRGGPCYAAAYRDLAARTDASRFVILGTNHFGQSSSVVGTSADFETPFGIVRNDRSFSSRLADKLGEDPCDHEYDHVREHSVELQVILLRHLMGERLFTIVPFICPDICGPSGTAPASGRGVDLRAFALALRELIDDDDTPTCVIAGADLSHIGRYFQDDRDLDSATLRGIESSDRALLAELVAGRPEAFRQAVAATANATNICSAGCLYAVGVIMEGGQAPRLLRYHQAVTREAENCVTCAAMEWSA